MKEFINYVICCLWGHKLDYKQWQINEVTTKSWEECRRGNCTYKTVPKFTGTFF